MILTDIMIKDLGELADFLFSKYKEATTEQETTEWYKRFLVANYVVSYLKQQEPIRPVLGTDNDFYCGKCGKKIVRTIKIYKGDGYDTQHPDHLKPQHKCKFCKYCGQAVNWDERPKED